MNGFRTETQGTSTFLCYELKRDEVIDQFDYGMMRNNTIAGLLPVMLSEIDGKTTVKYDITSKITLRRYLEGEVSKKQFLAILRKMLQTFQELQAYMLKTDHLFTEYDTVFIDMNKADVYMTYLPVEIDGDEDDLRLYFRGIVFQAKYDNHDDNSYIFEVINYLNSSTSFSISEFEKLLKKLEESGKKRVDHDIPDIQKAASQNEPIIDISQIVTKVVPEVEQIVEDGKKGLFGKKDKKDKKENSGAKTPSSSLGFRIPGKDKGIENVEPVHEPESNRENKKKGFLFGKKKTEQDSPKMNIPQGTHKKVIHTQNPIAGYGMNEQGQFGVIKEQLPPDPNAVAYLVRVKNQEKIILNKGVMKIGRKQDVVDYCISDNGTVGRRHADIVYTDEGYKVIDNNSKNHTYVNRNQIESGVLTVLKHEDRVAFSNEEFIFYLY